MIRRLISALTMAVAVACATAPKAPPAAPAKPVVQAPPEPIHLTIAGTNDIHGWVYPHTTRLASGGEVEQGGVATLAGYLKILRAKNPGGVVLLDGGDLFQGTLASNMTEGHIVVEVMNELGYDATAIGNHEFDYGPVGPISVATDASMDPFGALEARMAEAKFPMLGVNLYDAKTGQRPAWLPNDGTVMIERRGLKVGIVGLTTPATATTTNPVNVASLRFGSLIPEAQSAARHLREKGADLVIAVAHAGSKCAHWDNPKDISSCDATGEIIEMLQALPPHTVDAVVAGHTHAPMGHLVNGTPVIETWGMGESFGTIDLWVDPVSHRVLDDKTEIHPVIDLCAKVDQVTNSCSGRRLKDLTQVNLVGATFMNEPVQVDGALVEKLAPALARVEAEQNRALGLKVPAPLTRNYEAESPLGDVLADALREMEGADVALLNSGGLRADIPAGQLRYGQLYEVLPFDNTLATLTVSGEELKRLVLAAYGARKGVFQESGLKVKLSQCPGQTRLKSFTLADGRQVSPSARYKVVLPDFLARGGDGLGPVVESLPAAKVDLGMTRQQNFRDALAEHLAKKKSELVAPKPGRLTFVDDGKGCNAGEKLDLHAQPH